MNKDDIWLIAVTAGKWQKHGISEAMGSGIKVLAIDADSFSRGAGNVEEVLRKICEAVHGFGDVKVKNER